MILGICSSSEYLNYEKSSLYKEAQNVFSQVLVINPRLVIHRFMKGTSKPHITQQGNDLSQVRSLIVRSTNDREAATAVLVRSLKLCGCDIFDPIERFSVGKASKLLTTLTRFEDGVGTNSYITFTKETAITLVEELVQGGHLPVIAKPVTGKQGKNIELIQNLSEGLEYVEAFYASDPIDEPFFLQDYMSFKEEYRVIIVDGKSVGVVKKIAKIHSIAANVAQGGSVILIDRPDIEEFVVKNVSREGILGVDVAIDASGEFHLIEANRAPQWQSFEKATNVNIAKIIIDRALERLKLS